MLRVQVSPGAPVWKRCDPFLSSSLSLRRHCLYDKRRRRFDVIAVWKFDRFARSVSHLLRALDTFRVLGIEFVSLSESLDTATPAERVVFTVLGAAAGLERSLIAACGQGCGTLGQRQASSHAENSSSLFKIAFPHRANRNIVSIDTLCIRCHECSPIEVMRIPRRA